MQKLATSLNGMEIAIPPAEASDFKKTVHFYSRKPLPPLPTSQVTQHEQTASQQQRRTLIIPSSSSSPPSSSFSHIKPLVGSKSSPKLSPRPPTRGKQITCSRRVSISSPPTGHCPSKKVQQLMGWQVDIFDERADYPDINDSTDSPSDSESSDMEDFRSFSPPIDRLSLGSFTEGTSTKKSSWATTTYEFPEELQLQQQYNRSRGLLSLADAQSQSKNQSRKSNVMAARDYHKFATEIAGSSEEIPPPTDEQQQFLHPRRQGASPRRRQQQQSGGRRAASPSGSTSSTVSSVVEPHQMDAPKNAGPRPFSAFESDSSDDDDDGDKSGKRGAVGDGKSGIGGHLRALLSRREEENGGGGDGGGKLMVAKAAKMKPVPTYFKSSRSMPTENGSKSSSKSFLAVARGRARDWKAEKRREQRKREIRVVRDETAL